MDPKFRKDIQSFLQFVKDCGAAPWRHMMQKIDNTRSLEVDSNNFYYLAQDAIVENPETKEIYQRIVNILHNSTYNEPVLWFNYFKQDGSDISFEELRQILQIDPSETKQSVFSRMSLAERPVLGGLFYNIHPCNTKEMMKDLNGEENYIAKWLSIYGPQIGLTLPVDGFVSNK